VVRQPRRSEEYAPSAATSGSSSFVVWAGWTLDAADFGLYSLVLRPALTDLLGGNPSIAEIGKVGGLLSMTGLLGWAFGGFLFGIIADFIGRVRTLAFST
jgi:MFS family permease